MQGKVGTKGRLQEIKEAKSVTEKIIKEEEFIVGPKHKPAERTAVYDPKNNDLLTDEKEILAAKLGCNVGVLTKNTVQPMDLQSVIDKNELHETVMNDTDSMHKELLSGKTYRDVLRNF